LNRLKRLSELHEQLGQEPWPETPEGLIENEFGLSVAARYQGLALRNPLLVAPGSMTVSLSQIKAIVRAGYAGAVLKSVVGEDAAGGCAMIAQRKQPTYVRTVYEPDDIEGARPIIHWDGRLDARPLAEYLEFARDAKRLVGSAGFHCFASFLCHLPLPGHDFLEDEWGHTASLLLQAGYRHLEIDFCPFLSGDSYTEDQENILRWYRSCTGFIKSVSPELRVVPKLLNLDWDREFQLRMAEAAAAGGADGVVVANRIYKPQFQSGHGGEELRQRNLAQIRSIRERLPGLAISATGGVYCGRHVYDYLRAGAENVQLLSYLMGRVKKPFARTAGGRLDKVFHRLLLDPEDGVVACVLREGHWHE